MKKFLIKALAITTIVGGVSACDFIDPETSEIFTSAVKQVGSNYLANAQGSVMSKCMAKYKDADTCSCVTVSVTESLTDTDSDLSLSQRITAAQVNCAVQKLTKVN